MWAFQLGGCMGHIVPRGTLWWSERGRPRLTHKCTDTTKERRVWVRSGCHAARFRAAQGLKVR